MTNNYFNDLDNALQWVNAIASAVRKNIPKEEKHVRIKRVLSLLDNPHHYFKSVHITGSKGKSSTSYTCAYFLKEMGYTTGLFTSPHIHCYNERIRINQKNIDDDMLLSTINRIYQLTQLHGLKLTMFEIFTAIACIVFKEQGVSYAIFEVGIGGTYDTTNFLEPVLCIITNIEKEHTDILGHTLEEIAQNKAGIIKHKTPVFIGRQTYPYLLDILLAFAKNKNAPSVYLPDVIEARKIDKDVYTFPFSQKRILQVKDKTHNVRHWDGKEIISHTPSSVIVENQILADVAMHALLEKQVSSQRVYGKDVQLMCRSEVIEVKNQYIFLDGAHTRLSIMHAFECLSNMQKKIVLIFSLIKGKDYRESLEVILPYQRIIETVIISTPGNFRSSEPECIYELFKNTHLNTMLLKDPRDAMEHGMTFIDKGYSLAVIGSFFLCADCRTWLTEHTDFMMEQ